MSKKSSFFGRYYDKIAGKFFDYYKINIIISTLLAIFLISFLIYNYYTTGDLVERGVDFKGGYQYVLQYNATDATQIIKELKTIYPGINIQYVPSQHTIYLESPSEIKEEDITSKGVKILSKRKIQSTLASTFWSSAIKLVIIAYTLISIIVFVIFRSFVPSIAVILAGISDIFFAMFLMDMLHIPLTMGTLSSLLILMGYSIDTDILLTTRTLKEKPHNLKEALILSSKTGLTMTMTSIVAMIALIIFSPSITLDRIATVILAGLVADIIFTWFQNASILRIYIERKNKK